MYYEHWPENMDNQVHRQYCAQIIKTQTNWTSSGPFRKLPVSAQTWKELRSHRLYPYNNQRLDKKKINKFSSTYQIIDLEKQIEVEKKISTPKYLERQIDPGDYSQDLFTWGRNHCKEKLLGHII